MTLAQQIAAQRERVAAAQAAVRDVRCPACGRVACVGTRAACPEMGR